MSAMRAIVLPIFADEGARAPLKLARLLASPGSVMQLLYLSEHDEKAEDILARLEIAPEQLFHAVVCPVKCQPADYQNVLLDAAAKAEMMIFAEETMQHEQHRQLLQAVIARNLCPVIVSNAQQSLEGCEKIGNIIVPHDGSPSAEAAVTPALTLAKQFNAQLHILHTAPFVAQANEPGSLPLGRYMDQPQYEWPIWMREFWDRFLNNAKVIAPAVNVELHIGQGELRSAIEQAVAAFNCGLVVMAASSTRALPQDLIEMLDCPLMLVPAGSPADTEHSLQRTHHA